MQFNEKMIQYKTQEKLTVEKSFMVGKMDIGEKIKTLRKLNNKSQEELALDIGVSRQTVNKWETNKSQPSTENLLLICSIFEVSADYFLDSETVENEDTKVATNISTPTNNRKRIVLTICAVVDAILFVLSATCTVLRGLAGFSNNTGYIVVGTEAVGISNFVFSIIFTVILLVVEVLIMIYLSKNRQRITSVDANSNRT